MAKKILFILIPILWIACRQKEKPTTEPGLHQEHPSIVQHSRDTLCFIRVSGNNGRDTAIVHLIINGDLIEGKMTDKIWEKDSRRGELHGSIQGNNIQAIYIFMQEGITDSLRLDFKLTNGDLFQKPVIYSTSDGKQIKNPSGEYELKYIPASRILYTRDEYE